MRYTTKLAGLVVFCAASTQMACARQMGGGRAALDFATPAGPSAAVQSSCGAAGPSRVMKVHPPVLERLRTDAAKDSAEQGPIRAWADGSRVAWNANGITHGFAAESSDATVMHAFTARIDGQRRLLEWTEGTVEAGYRVRMLPLGVDGFPSGAPATIADDQGGVMGRADVAFGAGGAGEVVYLASTEAEFRLVTTPLRCDSR